MRPLLFGHRASPLFGLHHPPLTTSARDIGVVLCNPFGHEAVRAHRAYRQLAIHLTKARFHVLRFDYAGTGDSAGASESATLSGWRDDIVTASEELRDTAGLKKIAWVGLRLGGTLAALSAEGRRDVDRLVMWDPIVRGREYLVELHRLHREFMRAENRWWKPPGDNDGVGTMVEALGFPLTEGFKKELTEIDLGSLDTISAKRVAIIISDETDGHRAMKQRLLKGDTLPSNITYETVPASAWNSEAAMNSSLVPIDAVQAIVAYLSEGRA